MALRTTRLLSLVLGPFGEFRSPAVALPLRVLAMIVLLAVIGKSPRVLAYGECRTAANIYRAFINQIEAQSGKGITPLAAEILITDAEYLIANC